MNDSSQSNNIVPKKPGTLSNLSNLIQRGLGISQNIRSTKSNKSSDGDRDKVLLLLIDYARNKYPDGGWYIDFVNHKICGNHNGRIVSLGIDVLPDLRTGKSFESVITKFDRVLGSSQAFERPPAALESVRANLRPYLKMIISEDDLELDEKLIYKRFIPGSNLLIYLATDQEKAIQHARQSDLEKWGGNIDNLFRIAENNLAQTITEKKFNLVPAVNGLSYCYGDGYDASRMILPEFRVLICNNLRRTDFLFGIPNREFAIVFFPSNQYHFDQIHNQVMKDFMEHSHRVSPNIFGADENGDLWIEKKITEITVNKRNYFIGEGG